MRTLTPFILLAALLLVTNSISHARNQDMAEHPRVYITSANVALAKRNIARHAWARAERDSILKEADTWLARPDDWYLSRMPGRNACFAYGLTGCPICGSSWGQWWSANAAWDNPGHVTCAKGHVLPDAEHPDGGTGYVGKDGRTHYFVGSYNAWVIENFTFRAANHLAYAYTLTGDERYAQKAALILDAIATIYPSCDKGSWDYPSNPPSGRLNRPWYQVARVIVHYTDQYDQIYNSVALNRPSQVNGLTCRQNIEENLLKNGAKYCYDEGNKEHALHNGKADYVRGALTVGVCLNIPEYVRSALEGPSSIYAMLENNIDRDGKYYETSALYADHSRELYISFAEPLYNLRSAAYPKGINLYGLPRFRSFLTLHNLDQTASGQIPPYGDTAPQTRPVKVPARLTDSRDLQGLEYLYERTDDPKERQDLGALLMWLADSDLEAQRSRASGLNNIVGGGFAPRTWLLFHATDAPKADTSVPERAQQLTQSALFGQKGIGILRSDAGKDSQALLLRYGPSLNHGHFDDLNINYFARDWELTYDLGYGVGSTHTQVGWSHQTTSHNLVVVDEVSQGRKEGDGAGGSLFLFADLPGVKVQEASSESYRSHGVSQYRRTVALLDGFLLDIFRVKGGKQHDYLFHSRGDLSILKGVSMGAEEAGSLAGPEFNWGDLQLSDGDMKGHPNQPYWNPPPGNGYGFLMHPRRGPADGDVVADWSIDADTHLRLTLAPEADTEIVTAVAPGIVSGKPKAHYVMARRKGVNLSSSFAAIAEPYAAEGPPTVSQVTRVPVTDARGDVEPIAVRFRNGNTEGFVYSSGAGEPHKADGVLVGARFAYARTEGDTLISLSLVGASAWESGGWRITPKKNAWTGSITSIDYKTGAILLDTVLPEGTQLKGKVVIFSGPGYTRNTAYRIRNIEKNGRRSLLHVDGTLDLGRGVVGKIESRTAMESLIGHEYARPVRSTQSTGFFDGKLLKTDSGVSTRVRSTKPGAPLKMTVDSTADLTPGDTFHYYDISAGDRFEILPTFSMVRDSPGQYRLTSDVEVTVTPPDSSYTVKVNK